MRFTVLASGSKANATVVEAQGHSILIDCGLSLRELSRRLSMVGMELQDLDALLITHLHSDHVKGVQTLLEKMPLTVFAKPEFKSIPLGTKSYKLHHFDEFESGPFQIKAIPLPHDDGGSFGFVLKQDDSKLVFATDLGFATEDLALELQNTDATVIESNHDLAMLAECSYPTYIKDRIRSDYGHLSNCQSAELLKRYLSKQCQHVVLAHLSEKANHPAQALATMHHAIANSVTVASQTIPTAWLNLEKSSRLQNLAAA